MKREHELLSAHIDILSLLLSICSPFRSIRFVAEGAL